MVNFEIGAAGTPREMKTLEMRFASNKHVGELRVNVEWIERLVA